MAIKKGAVARQRRQTTDPCHLPGQSLTGEVVVHVEYANSIVCVQDGRRSRLYVGMLQVVQ